MGCMVCLPNNPKEIWLFLCYFSPSALVVASGVCSNEKLIKRFQITSTYCCCRMHATFLAFRNCLQSQCIWKLLEKKRARKIGKKRSILVDNFSFSGSAKSGSNLLPFPPSLPTSGIQKCSLQHFSDFASTRVAKILVAQKYTVHTITYHLKSIHSKQF